MMPIGGPTAGMYHCFSFVEESCCDRCGDGVRAIDGIYAGGGRGGWRGGGRGDGSGPTAVSLGSELCACLASCLRRALKK